MCSSDLGLLSLANTSSARDSNPHAGGPHAPPEAREAAPAGTSASADPAAPHAAGHEADAGSTRAASASRGPTRRPKRATRPPQQSQGRPGAPSQQRADPALPTNWTEQDLSDAVERLDPERQSGPRYRLRNLRMEPLAIDIDEPLAVSMGGAWDAPANKCFAELRFNRNTKNNFLDPRTRTAKPVISLREARSRGDGAFREAALGMLDRTFAEVEEMSAITLRERAGVPTSSGRTRDLATNLNRRIRAAVKAGQSEDARLVREALAVLGVSL